MKFKPLQDRIVVVRKEAEEMAGLIVVPEAAKEKPLEGEVVSVGPGRDMDDGTIRPVSVKVGDTVLFGKYSGNELELDGRTLLILREADVLGTLA